MPVTSRLPIIPASFFGIVLGLAGLANAWRAAHRVWHLPTAIGETLMGAAAVVWLTLIVLFAGKWIVARDAALAEARQPIQCCFIGLVGVTTMLIALGALPYSHGVAALLFIVGAAFALAFGVWRTGALWKGDRDPATTTPVLYLPTVGSALVVAVGASAFGFAEWGQLAFGMGLFSWIAIESVLLHRLYNVAAMPVPLRPTLGILFAPAAVAALAYAAISSGPPDWFAHALVGYALVQALIVLRLLPWILEQPFAASYWGFTFGITALAAAPLRMIEKGDTGVFAELAPFVFVLANIAMATIVLGTVRLIVQGRLLPPSGPLPTTPVPTPH